MLSEGSASEPGKWHTQPQQRAVLDAFTEPAVTEIDVLKSSRVGYTKMLNIIMGFCMHWRPCSVLAVQPTESDAQDYSKDEIAPMIRDLPDLEGLVLDSNRRESGNTIARKEYPGGVLDLVGANSPGSFRRLTKRVVLFDEVDGYPPGAGKEGDQIALGKKRAQDFADRKYVLGSSPTIAGSSKIEREFALASKGYCMVPCPHCGEFHVRKFHPDKEGIECGDKRLPVAHVAWDDGSPDTAGWHCPACSERIGYEHHRDQLDQCYWQGEHWEWHLDTGFDFYEGFRGRIGFALWAGYTYSPNTTPPHLAAEFLESKGDPLKLQTFTNTVMGELWHVRGDAPKWQEVADLKRPYLSGTTPKGILGLTCGVDVQKNRFVYSVRGWGRSMTSWLIEADELYGDLEDPARWASLAALLDEKWGEHAIRLMLVDSGAFTAQVYDFCRRYPQVRATKGHATLSKPFYASKVDVSYGGRVRKGGLTLWHLDTDHYKTWVHGRIAWPADQPGAWNLPEDVSDDYCRQIVAESSVTHANGKRTWLQHDLNNHWLDCEQMNVAAAQMLQIHRMAPHDEDDGRPARPVARRAVRVR